MKIYIVQDYDTVVYAGTSIRAAQNVVKGSGTIQVWIKGKYSGFYRHEFQKGWVLHS